MAWVRVDDNIDEHPKHVAAGPLALALYVAGLAYCNRNLTDGFIPAGIAKRLLTWEHDGHQIDVGGGAGFVTVEAGVVIDALIKHGLWKTAKGGYRVHDYGDYQLSKQQILTNRNAAKERMQKVRKSRGSHELQAKFGRSSQEVRLTPTPTPTFTERSATTTQREEEEQNAVQDTSTEDHAPPLRSARKARSAPARTNGDEPDDDLGLEPDREGQKRIANMLSDVLGGVQPHHEPSPEERKAELDEAERRQAASKAYLAKLKTKPSEVEPT